MNNEDHSTKIIKRLKGIEKEKYIYDLWINGFKSCKYLSHRDMARKTGISRAILDKSIKAYERHRAEAKDTIVSKPLSDEAIEQEPEAKEQTPEEKEIERIIKVGDIFHKISLDVLKFRPDLVLSFDNESDQDYLTDIIRKTALHCVETLKVIEEQRERGVGG